MHDASNEAEKTAIMEKIQMKFGSLSAAEKKLVQKTFSQLWDEKLKDTEASLKKVDIAIELAEISKYISLSQIAKDYFGKSKEWLYQRIKGYNVNGKPAQFTEEEKKKLSAALKEISHKIQETSLKIA